MANKNYPVRPDSSLKAAPVRKKDVTEVLLEVNGGTQHQVRNPTKERTAVEDGGSFQRVV